MSSFKQSFEELFEHKMSDAMMREFLIGLKLDSSTSVEHIATAATVMREHSTKLVLPQELVPKLIDIVGTGGDKSGSFNISTTVSIICAAAGCYVAKHGNRSITSKSGSADVLDFLGVNLNLGLKNSATLLEESGFTFMFAQNHHSAMKFIMPVRKSINEKTVFNLLGPLTNPAGVQKFLLGVFDKEFVEKVAYALKLNGSTSAIVVSAKAGMDEIDISDITYAAQLQNGNIKEYEIDPQAYGIKKAPFEALLGGDAKENAKIMLDVFSSNSTDAQRDIVLINAANALVADGIARDIQDGLEISRDVLQSKKALQKLNQIVEISSKL